MSDGLSAFFAKKKDKKKKTAVKIEEVGQVLERRAKRQEEYEQEHEEAEKRPEEEKPANPAEESEWIEYGDSNQGRLEGLKIKDMGLESEEDHVHNEEPEDREVHETKTWGQVSSEKKAGNEEPEHAVTISDKAMAAAYKPPAMRRNFGGGIQARAPAANFDMSSDSAFPSLADASKIEKVKKEETKSPGGWTKAGSTSGPVRSSYPTTAGSGREAALAAVKNMMSSVPASSTRAESTPSPTPAAAPAPTASSAPAAAAAPKAGTYVPPALRKKQQTTA